MNLRSSHTLAFQFTTFDRSPGTVQVFEIWSPCAQTCLWRWLLGMHTNMCSAKHCTLKREEGHYRGLCSRSGHSVALCVFTIRLVGIAICQAFSALAPGYVVSLIFLGLRNRMRSAIVVWRARARQRVTKQDSEYGRMTFAPRTSERRRSSRVEHFRGAPARYVRTADWVHARGNRHGRALWGTGFGPTEISNPAHWRTTRKTRHWGRRQRSFRNSRSLLQEFASGIPVL